MNFIKRIFNCLFGEKIPSEPKICINCENCVIGEYEYDNKFYNFKEHECIKSMRIRTNMITGEERLVGYTCEDMRKRGDWLHVEGCEQEGKFYKEKKNV